MVFISCICLPRVALLCLHVTQYKSEAEIHLFQVHLTVGSTLPQLHLALRKVGGQEENESL